MNTITIKTSEAEVSALSLKPVNDNFPYIVYGHGLYSSKASMHSLNMYKVAKEIGCGFLSFDNLGHGKTDFPLEKSNMVNWISTAKEVIENIVPTDRDIILVANSFSAGVLFNVAQDLSHKISGFIGISAAPDVLSGDMKNAQGEIVNYVDGLFTTVPKLEKLKPTFDKGNIIYIPFPGLPEGQVIPLCKDIFKSASQFSVIGSGKLLNCPAVLYQGDNDECLHSNKANRFAENFNPKAQVISVKNGAHNIIEAVDDITNTIRILVTAPSIQVN